MLLLLGCVWFAVANAKTIDFVFNGQFNVVVDGCTHELNPYVTLCAGTYSVSSTGTDVRLESPLNIVIHSAPQQV